MKRDEYVQYDALGLANLVRGGEVTAHELLEAAIDATESLNPTLNAVINTFYDDAMRYAQNGTRAGPFAGVPFLMKDVLDLEGTVASLGTTLGRENVAQRNHPLVDRIQACGLVTFGKTNMSELGLLPTTEPSAYGPTANPWALDRSPGGSSGGAAAAVAAGFVPMAHAADGGGSIRIPAAACGLFGLKPSRGRHPAAYDDDPDGFICHGVLSRSVRDSAAFLDATHGARPTDRWWAPPPGRTYQSLSMEDPPPLRISFSTQSFRSQDAHPDCRDAVAHAAQLCESLGHQVDDRAPAIDFEEWAEGFSILWSMCAGYFMERIREALSQDKLRRFSSALSRDWVLDAVLRAYTARTGKPPLEPITRELVERNRTLTPAHHWIAWTKMNAGGEKLREHLERYDVFILPVLGEPPWKTGHLPRSAKADELSERLFDYAGYTPISNTAGLPAMSVPLHVNADSLPIGVQFVAPFAREDILFSLAGQLERAQPWRDAPVALAKALTERRPQNATP